MAAESEDGFAAYVEALSAALGHADRRGPFREYCLGLLMPVERKSVEPLAATTAPGRTSAQHQSLLHFVGQGSWSDERIMSAVRDQVLPSIEYLPTGSCEATGSEHGQSRRNEGLRGLTKADSVAAVILSA